MELDRRKETAGELDRLVRERGKTTGLNTVDEVSVDDSVSMNTGIRADRTVKRLNRLGEHYVVVYDEEKFGRYQVCTWINRHG